MSEVLSPPLSERYQHRTAPFKPHHWQESNFSSGIWPWSVYGIANKHFILSHALSLCQINSELQIQEVDVPWSAFSWIFKISNKWKGHLFSSRRSVHRHFGLKQSTFYLLVERSNQDHVLIQNTEVILLQDLTFLHFCPIIFYRRQFCVVSSDLFPLAGQTALESSWLLLWRNKDCLSSLTHLLSHSGSKAQDFNVLSHTFQYVFLWFPTSDAKIFLWIEHFCMASLCAQLTHPLVLSCGSVFPWCLLKVGGISWANQSRQFPVIIYAIICAGSWQQLINRGVFKYVRAWIWYSTCLTA